MGKEEERLLHEAMLERKAENKEKLQAHQRAVEEERAIIRGTHEAYQELIVPIEQRFWQVHVPGPLKQLFDDIAQVLQQRHGVRHLRSRTLFYHGTISPYEGTSAERLSKQEKLLALYQDGRLTESDFPISAHYVYADVTIPERVSFGFRVGQDGVVRWSMGRGNITGSLNPTSEDELEKLAYKLAQGIEEKKYKIYPSHDTSTSESGFW